MTLRDYFAAKAMAAFLGAYPCQATADDVQLGFDQMVDLAADSYAMADAMLKARQ